MIVHQFKIFYTDRSVLYANSIYRLSKLSCIYNRDITKRDYEKCKEDCIVFKETDSINEMLHHVLQFKGEPKRVNNKIVKYNLKILALKGSSFDSYVVSNNPPQWRTAVSLIPNGLDIVSLELFNGYVDPVKKIPPSVLFRCGLLHIKDSVRKRRKL